MGVRFQQRTDDRARAIIIVYVSVLHLFSYRYLLLTRPLRCLHSPKIQAAKLTASKFGGDEHPCSYSINVVLSSPLLGTFTHAFFNQPLGGTPSQVPACYSRQYAIDVPREMRIHQVIDRLVQEVGRHVVRIHRATGND